MEDKVQKKKCFIITPIGEKDSDIFRQADGVIKSVIRPVLKEHGFNDICAAHEITKSGMINNQIINRIVEDDLVVANLTDRNPNVMYEVCLRHVTAKPIIHICETGTVLPFDIKDSRTIFYRNDISGCGELKDELEKYVKDLTYGTECKDNPIYTAIKYRSLLRNDETGEEKAKYEILLKILDGISELRQDIYNQEWITQVMSTFHDKYRIDVRNVDFTKIDWKMVDELLKEQPIIESTMSTLAVGLRISIDSLMVAAVASGIEEVTANYTFDNYSLVQVLTFIKKVYFTV